MNRTGKTIENADVPVNSAFACFKVGKVLQAVAGPHQNDLDTPH